MPKFDIESSAGTGKPRMEQRMIWLNQIEPDEFNSEIYNVTGIEALADDIRLNGLLQFPLVRYMPGGKYMIISGHRRVQAIRLLAKEDPNAWSMVPVILDPEKDETAAHIKLISANAVNRELSQWEIMQQTIKMHELLTEQKEKDSLPGRVRDMVAKKLNMSTGTVGEYLTISRNLIEPLKEQLKESGVISKALALELSRITPAQQEECYKAIQQGITFTAKEIKQFFQPVQEEKASDDVSEADTSQNSYVHEESTEIVPKNVSESDTQEKPQRWTLRSGYVMLPEEERAKILKSADMYGAANLLPCQSCKLATQCSGCCNVCQNKCEMIQGCHKKAQTEDKHEVPKEMPEGNICRNAEDVQYERVQQDNQAVVEAGRQEEREPDGESIHHAVEHAELENVSESDTKDNVHNLAWYQDMMRFAVVDVAVACQRIRELGHGCSDCPLEVNGCTYTNFYPRSNQYMLAARRNDKTLDDLFMEKDW